MSRCLVTGGAGFIGGHLVDSLLNDNHDVIVVDNESSTCHDSFYWNDSATNYNGNVCGRFETEAVFEKEKPEYVFHLAALSGIQEAIENPRKTIQNNLQGTKNIAACASMFGAKRVIFSSSASVYGPPPLNPYALSKIMGEEVFHDYPELEVVLLRYFNVYGERQPVRGDYAPVVGSFLKAKRSNEPLKVYGDGSQERDFVHIDDVIKCNILSAFSKNKEVSGSIINIGTGKSISILSLAKMIDNNVKFLPGRDGEIEVSKADTSNLEKILDFLPEDKIKQWVDNNNEPETVRQKDR